MLTRRKVLSALAATLMAATSAQAVGPGALRLRGSGVTPVTQPSSQFNWLPFNIYRSAPGLFSTDYNSTAVKPAYQNTIYCGAGGNNTNSGLTYPLRVRSWKQAISKANALGVATVRIVIDSGYYKLSVSVSSINDSWNNFPPTCGLVIEVNNVGTAGGRAINMMDVTMPSYTATSDANIYLSAYTSQTPGRQVIDMANPDPNGIPTAMAQVRTVVDVANPWPEINAAFSLYGLGASYLDTVNKKLYVRRVGNIAPDTNMVVLGAGNGAGQTSNASAATTIWQKGVSYWGGNAPFQIKSTDAFPQTLYGDDVHYLYGSGNNSFAWSGSGGFATHSNSIAAYSDQDGWNYHGKAGGITSATSCKFVEINCKGYWNGWDNTGTNNGTTCHEYCIGVRINGEYANNADRTIHDINNTNTWDLGCVSSARRGVDATETSAAFAIGGSGTGVTTKWMDTCVATSNYAGQLPQYPFESYTGCTMFYHNTTIIGSNPGAGAITAY